jgi:hypothetical protein
MNLLASRRRRPTLSGAVLRVALRGTWREARATVVDAARFTRRR